MLIRLILSERREMRSLGSPAERWQRMREWVTKQIRQEKDSPP